MSDQTRSVCSAQPYRKGATDPDCPTIKQANYMLLRQYQFPDSYSGELDELIAKSHDMCFAMNPAYVYECFLNIVGGDDIYLEQWGLQASNDDIFDFIIKMLGVDGEPINWTGYRITGTIYTHASRPSWALELFSKHPRSTTKVYSGGVAPNVMLIGDLESSRIHRNKTDYSFGSNYAWHMDQLNNQAREGGEE